jgi:hypothetical protein
MSAPCSRARQGCTLYIQLTVMLHTLLNPLRALFQTCSLTDTANTSGRMAAALRVTGGCVHLQGPGLAWRCSQPLTRLHPATHLYGRATDRTLCRHSQQVV